MRYKHPLKQILVSSRSAWDHDGTRAPVRKNFARMIECGTLALGAEVFASQNEEKIVPHTCKSRCCPSCGLRATIQWRRELWCALPNIAYQGIVLTMPDVLWPIFQQNRHLLHDLPRLAALVIEHWAKIKFDIRVLIIVMPHTFGGRLNFNCHLHILVSAGGLRESDGRWIDARLFRSLDKDELMHTWRFAVTTYLRSALNAGILLSDLNVLQVRSCLTKQEGRRWNIHIDHFASKGHFLRYAGRYVRHPPIAQHRILEITDQTVRFWVKDKREKRRVEVSLLLEEFVARLAEHVPDRHRHAMRYFGLLAPAARARTFGAMFVLLKQPRRRRPRRLSWAFLLRKCFGADPLIDPLGQAMKWVKRLPIVGAPF
jgi:hypothetical protein